MLRARLLLASLSAILLLGVVAPATLAAPTAAASRAASQEAVERVLWAHRIWPAANPGPKPAFDSVMSAGQVRAKVEETLRLSAAVARFTGRPVTGADLQREIERQAADTKQPDVLRELWGTLGNDPGAIAETLARPVVADRQLRAWYERTGRTESFAAWWASARRAVAPTAPAVSFAYHLPAIGGAAQADPGTWEPTFALPEATIATSSVWTGAEMIVWGGTEAGLSKFNSGSRYDPATDTWRTTSGTNAPFPRKQHTAVWTGTQMIVWGGCGLLDEHSCQINSGGRYDPATDTWAATTTNGAPSARLEHTAVWTGSAMIVWGGCRFSNDACTPAALGNSGGMYDPSTDTWQATSTAGAPTARTGHTAVWTGRQMIVWGGASSTSFLVDGARFDPAANAWTPTAAVKPSAARASHTAVWASNQMIVWGGNNASTFFGNGIAYSPQGDQWRQISTANAPSGRSLHTAVWTGSVMIVWGGCNGTPLVCNTPLGTGGRYDPSSNSWTPTATAGAPSARSGHRAVWTGSLMIVWGGASVGDPYTGGRYEPVSNSWTPTNATRTASAREFHSALWTGAEMIVWGGEDRFMGTTNTGARYTPATDSWEATSTANAPSSRMFHSAVWTGTRMIVWGGQYGSTVFKDGGRYDPASNAWQPTSPSGSPAARANHTAVWTGTQMVVWGGTGNTGFMNTGGRYDPAANAWTPTSTTGAPPGRYLHTAVWTGAEMIVWGGQTSTGFTDTGGRYDPAANAWTPTSTTGAPEGRYSNALVWTGTRMIAWGGAAFDVQGWTLFRTGGIYDPVSNTWTPTSLTDAPGGRLFFASGWTGASLVVWGGCTDDSTCSDSTNTGGQYDPVADAWTATPLIGAPSARGKLSGVWDGSELIVWGGATADSSTFTWTGGRYTPLAG